MPTSNPVREKSYSFALSIIVFTKKIMNEKKEYVLSKQLLRSGTSIGANIEEALQASSTKDFIYKLSIALREAHESHYWLRLITDSNFSTAEETKELFESLNQVLSLLTAIIKTTKKNVEK